MKAVIADAGPLIGLARMDQLALLPGLFDQVWITDVIAAEIGLAPAPVDPQSYPGLASLQLSCQQGWLQSSRQLLSLSRIPTSRSTLGWMQEKPARLG